jgi:hypothetical protein
VGARRGRREHPRLDAADEPTDLEAFFADVLGRRPGDPAAAADATPYTVGRSARVTARRPGDTPRHTTDTPRDTPRPPIRVHARPPDGRA